MLRYRRGFLGRTQEGNHTMQHENLTAPHAFAEGRAHFVRSRLSTSRRPERQPEIRRHSLT
jgi:hypothetical protein